MRYMFPVFNYSLLGLFAFCTLYPFLYVIVYSLNDGMDAMKGGLYFWPREFTINNYVELFKDSTIINAYKITIYRTVLGTLLHIVLNMLFGYALAKKSLPGRNFITFFIFIPTLFGGGLIPFFILLRDLNLLNTFWVYIVPSLYSFFHIIIIRTFLQQLPPELEESARIDGCGDLKIFVSIILPLSMPVLAVISIFIGVGHWNDWFTGRYFITDKDLMPVQTLLQDLLTQSDALMNAAKSIEKGAATSQYNMGSAKVTVESLKMAVLVVSTVPILLIYPFFQKHFVKGALLGSVKG
ncbi:carbohydrate ABC transporter permease [Paenibacillus sp. strain BS8-2]